ncbi:MAK10-like protein [Tanacetum coccineum]
MSLVPSVKTKIGELQASALVVRTLLLLPRLIRTSCSSKSACIRWHLEEIHVTWAQLEKKETRLQLYTKVNEENACSGYLVTRAIITLLSSPDGNNVVPLLSDTIRLVQNRFSFHGLRSEDPNQHLKDFLKLVDSLNLDVANRERTRLCLFQFSLRDQASNWLERLPAGYISTWEDLTTHFLAQFFSPGRTSKLQNDILMFQKHQVQIFYDHVNPAIIRTIDQSAGGKLCDKNTKESWELLEDLALYDNESWNDPRDFAKPVKEISLPQDVPSTSYRRLIKHENQVQRLMEAHLVPKSHVQVNKIASSREICSDPHDTQYCMKNSEQAFVDYASSRLVSNFMASQDARLSKFEANFKQQQGEMTNKINTFLKAINDRMTGALLSNTVKNPKLNVNSTSSVLSARYYLMENPQCSSHIHNSINSIKNYSKQTNNFQKDQIKIKTLTVNEIGTPKLKEPEQTLEDEFKDLHLNLSVLEVLAHAPMYNAILDKYVESLELGKSRSEFIQGKMPEKIKDLILFTLPCRLGDYKPFDTLADLDMDKDPTTPLLVGRGFLATANVVIDCRKAKIAVGVGVTRSIFGVKEIDLGE